MKVLQNISKVMAVACAVGFLFAVTLVDSDAWVRVLLVAGTCFIASAFFGTISMILEEVIDE